MWNLPIFFLAKYWKYFKQTKLALVRPGPYRTVLVLFRANFSLLAVVSVCEKLSFENAKFMVAVRTFWWGYYLAVLTKGATQKHLTGPPGRYSLIWAI